MSSETLARIQAERPDRLRPFLLASKRGFYRETVEYRQAELNERMRRKPKPTPRPMAGYGSNAYRTWSR